jgi:hypothetical protein
MIGVSCAALLVLPLAAPRNEAVLEPVSNKPFMLFVTPLYPPEGKQRAEAFSSAMFKDLKQFFDTTSFQAILVESFEKMHSLSNQKKDIFVTSDTNDCYLSGPNYDTLVVWIRYKVGLYHARVDVPYPKGHEAELPPMLARAVYRTIRNEFSGIVELQGGPPGMTITLVEGATVMPPRSMLLPPGDYFITSRYPGFVTRLDTLVVFQGRTTHKRILMLPE